MLRKRLRATGKIGQVHDGQIVVDEVCKCKHSRRGHEMGVGPCDYCSCTSFELGASLTRTASAEEVIDGTGV